MYSTNVNRTMQSGYSELMGLYPPGQGARLSSVQISSLSGVAAPPFKVRNAKAINDQLGDKALPEAFVQVHIAEYNNGDIHDDASTDGCAYINKVGSARESDKSVWEKYDWMIAGTQEPMKEALDVDQDYIDSLEKWHDWCRLASHF